MNRTTAITAASVGGVVIAGAALIGANFGILTAANASTDLGSLSVATDGQATATSASPSTTDTTTTTTTNPVLVYQVESAGTVEVTQTTAGLAFGEVVPADGWVWVPTAEGAELTGSFTNGVDTLQFAASVVGDAVAASVSLLDAAGVAIGASPLDAGTGPSAPAATPAVTAAPPAASPATVPPATTPSSPATYQDDDHDDDHESDDDSDDHDSDDHDSDDHDSAHEGSDDDD